MVNHSLVSIVVPSYNHARYIETCIESIMKQDFNDFELIVIDDGSSDNSPSILKELQKKYNFYLEINSNQGLSKTLNRGFRDIAKGKYFTFCASDDYWLPFKLGKQVKYMEENPACGMVFGKSVIIDGNGKSLEKETIERNKYLRGGSIFRDLFLCEFHPPVNYMLRGDVVRELGFYRDHIWAEDFDMNLRISSKYPIGYIDDYLSCYRQDDSSGRKMMNFKTIYSHLDSISLFRESPLYPKALKKWYYKCFLWYSPFTIGKKLAVKGMLHNLDLFYKKEFLVFLSVLIKRWQ